MKNTSRKNSFKKGFDLVEMLVVIGVIGVIAAIAIPNIASINNNVREAKNQRNAQSIVSIYAAATAAQAKVRGTTVAEMVKDLVDEDGVVPTKGAFAGKHFKVPNITDEELVGGAFKYIGRDPTGLLAYDKGGKQNAKGQ
jgi:prepilin-type N-terminal cleavage/methylation domain-containing protein